MSLKDIQKFGKFSFGLFETSDTVQLGQGMFILMRVHYPCRKCINLMKFCRSNHQFHSLTD